MATPLLPPRRQGSPTQASSLRRTCRLWLPLKMTLILCVCVRVCRQKKPKSRRVLLRKVSAWGKPDAERQRCLFSRGSPSHLAVKSPPSSKRGETRGGKHHSLQVEFGSWPGLIGRRDLRSDWDKRQQMRRMKGKESPESQSRPKVQFCL